jgi:OmpA-OmpF porin, OOP family
MNFVRPPHSQSWNAVLAMLAFCVSTVASAQASADQTMVDPLARTTPVSIARGYDAYQAQRDAMKALIDSGTANINGYDLAKAKCWLEVSFHEYTRNDRSGFAPEALLESQRITQHLSTSTVSSAAVGVNGSLGVSTPNPASQTLLVNGGQRLRSDLWQQAHAYKSLPGYGGPQACGEPQLACAEVHLAHAGNEINQQGWRHARPYIQLAEYELAAAKKAIDGCSPAPAAIVAAAAPVLVAPIVVAVPTLLGIPVAVVAPVMPAQAVVAVESPAPVAPLAAAVPAAAVPSARIVEPKTVVLAPQATSLAAEVLFNFDTRDLSNVRDYTKQRLDSLIAQIKSAGFMISSITLTGHADRMNLTGKPEYNAKLSQDRALVIKNYLINQGIAVDLISTAFKSDTVQVEACNAKFKKQIQFEECLLPNRRVEVLVLGSKR